MLAGEHCVSLFLCATRGARCYSQLIAYDAEAAHMIRTSCVVAAVWTSAMSTASSNMPGNSLSSGASSSRRRPQISEQRAGPGSIATTGFVLQLCGWRDDSRIDGGTVWLGDRRARFRGGGGQFRALAFQQFKQQKVAEHFISVHGCCLDAGYARRLRQRTGTSAASWRLDAVLSPFWRGVNACWAGLQQCHT